MKPVIHYYADNRIVCARLYSVNFSEYKPDVTCQTCNKVILRMVTTVPKEILEKPIKDRQKAQREFMEMLTK